MIGDNPLMMVSRLMEEQWRWVEDTDNFMKDEDFKECLKLAALIISDGVPESSKVASICARLQAYAVKFRMGYVAYMSYEKGTTDAAAKKNHYKELYTGIDKLVDALKYVAKN